MRGYIVDHYAGPNFDPDLYMAGYQQGFFDGAATAAAIGDAYVQGVTLAMGEGGNIALTISDLSEGNFAALVNVVPVAGRLISHNAGVVLLRKQGQIIGRVDQAFMRKIAREGCFVAGTLVATERGMLPIEAIWAEGRVWARDMQSGEWSLQSVVMPLIREHEGGFVTVTLESGQSVTATGNHPFWVVEGDGLADRPRPKDVPEEELHAPGGVWVEAGNLQRGDMLRLRSGETARITTITSEAGCRRVFNLWVDGVHTYAVGKDGVLVHNNSDECARVVKTMLKGQQAAERGLAYENWVRWVLGAAEEAPASLGENRLIGGTEKLMKVRDKVEFNRVADFDGFVGNRWIECKGLVADKNIDQVLQQLGAQSRAAESWDAQLVLVMKGEIPNEIIQQSKTLSYDIVRMGEP